MRLRTKQTGAAGVEFALLLIPLLLMLTGIFEFGRVMFYYNAIVKSARDAARLMTTEAVTDPNYAALKTRATCAALAGTTSPCDSATPVVPDLTSAMISICDADACPTTHAGVSTGTGVVNLVTVTIGTANDPYVYTLVMPLLPELVGLQTITFAPVSVTMRQIL